MWNREKVVKLIDCAKKMCQSYDKTKSIVEQCQNSGLTNYLDFKFVPKNKIPKGCIGFRNLYVD